MRRQPGGDPVTADHQGDTGRLVRVELVEDPGIWRVVLDRPPVNALNLALYSAVTAALKEVAEIPGARCVLLGSALDGAFCAGGDFKELATLTVAPGAEDVWRQREAMTADFRTTAYAFPLPMIAVIDGYAVGAGFVLASLCDIRVCSRTSWFAIPELAVQRAGGARHALRVLPQGVVRTMYFARARLGADRAHQLGFVEEVTDSGQVWDEALRLAREIAVTPASALRETKAALQLGEELRLAEGVELERRSSHRMAAAAGNNDAS
jgi:enoyl-CoA hydratase